MKFLLSTIVCLCTTTILFSGSTDKFTDIETPKMYSQEARNLSSESYECNYYIELAGKNLYDIDVYEKVADIKKIKSNYNLFIKHSSKAIEICSYVNETIVQDMIEIQEGVTIYYKGKYNE